MPFVLELPDQYSWVLAAASASFFVNTLHFALTGSSRKASGLKYPIPYASQEQAEKDPAAYKFNCAQRAHSNYTENLTPFLGALLISGLRYPQPAAILGAVWVVSRVSYALGYVSSGPKGRSLGSAGSIFSDLVLKCMAAYTSIVMIIES